MEVMGKCRGTNLFPSRSSLTLISTARFRSLRQDHIPAVYRRADDGYARDRKEDVVLRSHRTWLPAAVLAELAHKVYSMEIIEALAQQAVKRLSRAGYTNVEVKVANGSHGHPEHAPFDKVMVTAAPDLIPPP